MQMSLQIQLLQPVRKNRSNTIFLPCEPICQRVHPAVRTGGRVVEGARLESV